ncbi:MAG: hypothetical protein IJR28_00340 [Ottowia sp.]|nr:hypothetical protein [Ottowia sp.]
MSLSAAPGEAARCLYMYFLDFLLVVVVGSLSFCGKVYFFLLIQYLIYTTSRWIQHGKGVRRVAQAGKQGRALCASSRFSSTCAHRYTRGIVWVDEGWNTKQYNTLMLLKKEYVEKGGVPLKHWQQQRTLTT